MVKYRNYTVRFISRPRKNYREYKRIFESLQLIEPVNDEMLIVLTEYDCDTEEANESKTSYVEVSGRKLKEEINSITTGYAIEFVKWENWLGIDLAPESMNTFSELEIIAHYLYEMTFCGYDQGEIQKKINSINKTIDDYKKLTDEGKKELTTSLEDLKKKRNQKDGS